MPWKATNPLKERTNFVLEWERRWNEAEGGRVNLAELCRMFGVSRQSRLHLDRAVSRREPRSHGGRGRAVAPNEELATRDFSGARGSGRRRQKTPSSPGTAEASRVAGRSESGQAGPECERDEHGFQASWDDAAARTPASLVVQVLFTGMHESPNALLLLQTSQHEPEPSRCHPATDQMHITRRNSRPGFYAWCAFWAA